MTHATKTTKTSKTSNTSKTIATMIADELSAARIAGFIASELHAELAAKSPIEIRFTSLASSPESGAEIRFTSLAG